MVENLSNSPKQTLDQFFLNNKKLKEAETQFKSLSLILRNNNCPELDIEALEQNKKDIQQEIDQLKKNMAAKDLKRYDINCFIQEENHDISQNSLEESGSTGELSSIEANDISEGSTISEEDYSFIDVSEQQTVDFLREQNAKLRRRLSQVRKQQQVERSSVMEQLKLLEIETNNGEKQRCCELRQKQVELEETLKRNLSLLKKNEELKRNLKDETRSRKREAKVYEDQLNKKEQIYDQVTTKLEQIRSEKDQLKNSLQDVKLSLEQKETVLEDLKAEKDKLRDGICQENKRNQEINGQFLKSSNEVRQCRCEIEKLRNENIELNNKLLLKDNEINGINVEFSDLRKGMKLDESKEIGKMSHSLARDINSLKRSLDNGKSTLLSAREVEFKESKEMCCQTEEIQDDPEKVLLKTQNDKLQWELSKTKYRVVITESDNLKKVDEIVELREKIRNQERRNQELADSLANVKKAHPYWNNYKPFESEDKNILTQTFDDLKIAIVDMQQSGNEQKENVEKLENKWSEYKRKAEEIQSMLYEINKKTTS